MSKKVEKFEELIAWQKARKLTGRIYQTTNLGNFARDYSLKDQIGERPSQLCPISPRDLKEVARRNSIGSW